MKLSTLILVHNESANLPACLGALSWCDDIVVVDSGSTDNSVCISVSYGARVFVRSFDDFAAQRNFGLEEGSLLHEWVLHLDADEIVTPAFAEALAALNPPEGIDAFRVPFKLVFFGKWLRHAGMWPGYQTRIGHARRLRFVQVGHGQREALLPSRVGTFSEALLHYSFSHGLKSWFEKHVRYASDEARLIAEQGPDKGSFKTIFIGRDRTERRRAAKALASALPPFMRPAARFAYIYVLRRGFLDGTPGFVYAVMLSVYEAMTAIFVYDMKRNANDLACKPAGKANKDLAVELNSPVNPGLS